MSVVNKPVERTVTVVTRNRMLTAWCFVARRKARRRRNHELRPGSLEAPSALDGTRGCERVLAAALVG